MLNLSALKWPILICVITAAVTVWLISSLFPGPGISLLVPDDSVLTITKPGRYTLWSQVESSFQGKLMTFPTGLPPGVTIAVTKEHGSIVPLNSQWPTTNKETASGAIQVAIGTITFDSPGSYRVTTQGLHEKRALYLDQSDVRYFFSKIFLALLIQAVFVGCLIWGIVIFVLRRRKPA
ncbi:MAG: hypothetical protein ACJ8NS_15045 [Chthoniobacterales bacterium]